MARLARIQPRQGDADRRRHDVFYLLLALFPAMAVLVSLFGLVADPARIVDQLTLLDGVLPSSAIDVITGQLKSFATQTTRP